MLTVILQTNSWLVSSKICCHLSYALVILSVYAFGHWNWKGWDLRLRVPLPASVRSLISSQSLKPRRLLGHHRLRCNNTFPPFPVHLWLGNLQTPVPSIPWCYLPISSSVFLSFLLLLLSPAELILPCPRILRCGHTVWVSFSLPWLGDHHALQLHSGFCCETWIICKQIRILRVNNTYRTYTMDFTIDTSTYRCLTPSHNRKRLFAYTPLCSVYFRKPQKTCHFLFGELKSPGRTFRISGVGGWVSCKSGWYCLLVKFQFVYKLFNFTS